MVAISSLFARGVVKTGLGNRFGTYFVKWFGKTPLGLSYGLVIGEMLVAPTMPSVIARAGGVFLPIIHSTLSSTGDSTKKLGSYLFQSQLQVTAITHFESFMFINDLHLLNLFPSLAGN